MDLTNEDVADILALLDSLPYDSLDVETPRFRLTLRRAPDGGWSEESRVLAEPTLAPAPNGSAAAQRGISGISGMPGSASGATPATAVTTSEPETAGPDGAGGTGATGEAGQAGGPRATAGAAADSDGLAVVAAPLPGTFYRAPRPGADPFVQVGDVVGVDTVVAIVETMKLMNSVHAGTAGRVARICLDNGEFAPVGATLMLIEPGA